MYYKECKSNGGMDVREHNVTFEGVHDRIEQGRAIYWFWPRLGLGRCVRTL
ncbi:MAG TPA: hypothetical protein VNJ02_11455 [Vicinamibacterales bacterium]|nr:hypothetical protein [Vicinamibacterales bacterium]